MTFKESKDLYNAIKDAILAGPPYHCDQLPAIVYDVASYYQEKRQNTKDAAPLDLTEVEKLQTLIKDRFGGSTLETDAKPSSNFVPDFIETASESSGE